MSYVYLFSHVGLCVFPYLLNYITSLYWKLSENYKHGCRNDQPICKNKGRNESNELSSNNLRCFQNNLGLVFHTTYSCIFHSCYLLLLFPLLHFSPVRSYSCYFHSRIFRPCNFDRIAFSTPAFSVAPRHYERILIEIVVFKKGWVTLSANFGRMGGRPPTTTVGVRKLESLGRTALFAWSYV